MATLSGTWTLKAVEREAGWRQRIVISGSGAHDGPHEMVVGTTLTQVTGSRMTITAQAFDEGAQAWVASLTRETLHWDDKLGLTVLIAADDNPPRGDHDFNDLVVLCTTDDAELSSPFASPRPDLTLPERFMSKAAPVSGQPHP